METINSWSLCAVMGALAIPQLAFADGHCSHSTKVRNDSNVTLRIVELKSAVAPPLLFKSQWKGDRSIAPGASSTILWTSDFACSNSSGDPNTFDVKLVRKVGETHYCGGLSPSAGESVALSAPDLCFVQ